MRRAIHRALLWPAPRRRAFFLRVHGRAASAARPQPHQFGRTILHVDCTGADTSAALSTLTGSKPMSVSSALYLAFLPTLETTIGSCTWWSSARIV